MPKLKFQPSYVAAYKKFTKRDARRVIQIDNAITYFGTDPDHPSLHLERLSGTALWTIRVNRGTRMFFTWSESGDTAIFFFVGPHDTYRRIKR